MNQLSDKKTKVRWHYRPDLRDQIAPYYRWPPRLGRALRYMVDSWGLLGVRIYVLGMAILSWYYFSPALERCQVFAVDWVGQIWLRNCLTMLLVAGSLHLYFYR